MGVGAREGKQGVLIKRDLQSKCERARKGDHPGNGGDDTPEFSGRRKRRRAGRGGGLRDLRPEHVYRLSCRSRRIQEKRRILSKEPSQRNCEVIGRDTNGGAALEQRESSSSQSRGRKTGAS